MRNKFPSAFLAVILSGPFLFAQQQAINTNARSTDWEEINFEFNQAVIVDGFPTLLRLADLLKRHQDFKITLTGNADQVGSARYNQTLSQRRAQAVSDFLQHYGATAAQIQIAANGEKNPEVPGRGPNQRFVNRRVTITVTAPDGTQIGDGSLPDAVIEFQNYVRGQLNKIDAILSQLHDLEDQVKALQGDTGSLKQSAQTLQQSATAIQQDTGAIHNETRELVGRPAPLTADQTTQIARAEATRAADYALTQSALRNRKYSLIGFDAGPTFANGSKYVTGKTGIISADVFGKALIPFGNGKTAEEPGTHGLQVEGNWVYFRKHEDFRDGRNDGIFNIGLVNRFNHVQVGTFAQFDYASFNSYQGGALLGAGILTIDFVMPHAVFGVFGGKGFREYANLSSSPGIVSARLGSSPGFPGSLSPAYLRYDDQVGVHASAGIGVFQFDGSAAYLKRYVRGASIKAPAASIKLSYVPGDHLAFYLQADQDPTFHNLRTGDRVLFGIEFGNWLRPKDYGSTQGVVPVAVPLPHYEILAR